MKTIAINGNYNIRKNNVTFKGHSAKLDEDGFKEHKFFTPYDPNKYTAEIEFVSFKEKNGNWIPNSEPKSLKIPPNGVIINNYDLFAGQKAVGYRFVFKSKENPEKIFYKADSGIVSNPLSSNPKDHFSILLNNRSLLPENKLTKQVMPDLLPGFSIEYGDAGSHCINFNKQARLKALNSVRTHGNKMGGNFAGIIKMLPSWSEEGYTKIVGTPFTKDEVSSHLYWTENPYQISGAMGTLEDFKTLQVELFKNGINFIADGAFVNQGLQGTMFKNVLKHGENSPFFHWFKASGLKDGDLKLGAIPKNQKAKENFRFRLVNLPVTIVEPNRNRSSKEKSLMRPEEVTAMKLENNPNFDPKKPSYVQLYDNRLVTSKELNATNTLLNKYSILNTKNPYEITSHDDITQILTFEVNPTNYAKRIKSLFLKTSDNEKYFTNNNFIEKLLKFPYFSITTKDKGGVDLWDGNMDIAKLNFYTGNTDQKYINKFSNNTDKIIEADKMDRAIHQVQDFTINAGKYWTKVVADAQTNHILNLFKDTKLNTDAILKKIAKETQSGGNLPKLAKEVMTREVVDNILSNAYTPVLKKHKMPDTDSEILYFVQYLIMQTPFASYEFDQDLSAVFISPYISGYSVDKGEETMDRFEEYVEDLAQMESLNKGEFTNAYRKMCDYIYDNLSLFVGGVLRRINELNEINAPCNLTYDPMSFKIKDYGQYVIPFLVPEITKYAIVKSLKPDADIEIDEETGEIKFDPKTLSEISLKSLGISGTPEDEALAIIQRLEKGTLKLRKDNEKEKLAVVLQKRLEKMPIEKFKLAEAIIDRTGSGLGWRIDAAKDIANIDAIRSGNDNDEELLNTLCDFWGKFNKAIKSVNRNAYTTAEITDFDQVVKTKNEFKNPVDAETKFIERSGLNNTANYMFFYSLLRDMFAADAEQGYTLGEFNKINKLTEKLIQGWGTECHGFLYQYPNDSIANSYTFVGNHDKPRVLHVFALDMNLFHSDFSSKEHVDRAKKVLSHDKDMKIDPYHLSSKAIAMGEKILSALDKCGFTDTYLKKAVSQLSNGYYKDEKFDADAFGSRDLRFAIKDVFDVAWELGYKPEDKDEQISKVLEVILTPAMDKMETVYKMLVTLPGSPTDFVGDKEGSSGYESKSNNIHQQNRNTVPFEWVNGALNINEFDGNKKDFAKNYYIRMTKIGNLRNIKELSALRNGDTISLPLQDGEVFVKNEQNENAKSHDTKVAATFRYDEKGSQVICLYTTEGAAGTDLNQKTMNRPRVDLDKIVLTDNSNWKSGLKGGLKEGDLFKNINDDKATYKVCLENGKYVLRNADSYFTKISILPEDKNTAILYKYEPLPQPVMPAHFVLY